MKIVTLKQLAAVCEKNDTQVRTAWAFMAPLVKRYHYADDANGRRNKLAFAYKDVVDQMRLACDGWWDEDHETHLYDLAMDDTRAFSDVEYS